MKFIDKNKIFLNKPLNDLDKLVLRFVKIIEKYVEYVIVSGYVSLLFGRSRSTEDVDLFIRVMNIENFAKLSENLKSNGFWCLNAESNDEMYSYLKDGLALRFANKGEIIPNFEVKFAIKYLAKDAFIDPIEVMTNEGSLKISSLEKQIAFKRYYLKSDKDLEDARYIEKLFKDKLNKEKIKKYKELIDKYEKTESRQE